MDKNSSLWLEMKQAGYQTADLEVLTNAEANRHKNPNMRTLMEEVSEAVLADRGKHDDPLRLELIQIAGVCINMIRRLDAGEDVSLKS